MTHWQGCKSGNNYHLKINHEGYTINLTQGSNYFDPTGLNNRITNTEISRDQIINELADKKYKSKWSYFFWNII